MKEIILKLLLTTFAVFVLSHFLSGATIDNLNTALTVSIILGLLQVFIKPIIEIVTLPITIITLGLFLSIINTILLLITDFLMEGFHLSGFWTALLFSWLLSMSQSFLFSFLKKEN